MASNELTAAQRKQALASLLDHPGWKLFEREYCDEQIELAWTAFKEARIESWTTKKSVQIRADCRAAEGAKNWVRDELRALGWDDE